MSIDSELDRTIPEMVARGLMERFDENGEPRYRLTAAGRAFADDLIARKPAAREMFAKLSGTFVTPWNADTKQ